MKTKTRKAKKKWKHVPGPFDAAFRAQLDKIEEDAKAIGANMTIVCKAAGVSRAGPVRWRNDVPTTIKLMDRMAMIVDRLAQKRANNSK
jgi:hypothetical protein